MSIDETRNETALVKAVHQASDLAKLQGIISGIGGERCWDAYLSYAEELSLEIGERIPYPQKVMHGKEHGSWMFGSRGTAWELTSANSLWVSSDDEEDVIRQKIQVIKDTTITGIDVRYPDLDLILTFSNGYQLAILPTEDDDDYDVAYWELFTPDKMIVEAGPGATWSYSRADIPLNLKNKPSKGSA
jgi:hypothetical protein